MTTAVQMRCMGRDAVAMSNDVTGEKTSGYISCSVCDGYGVQSSPGAQHSS